MVKALPLLRSGQLVDIGLFVIDGSRHRHGEGDRKLMVTTF